MKFLTQKYRSCILDSFAIKGLFHSALSSGVRLQESVAKLNILLKSKRLKTLQSLGLSHSVGWVKGLI